MHVSMIGSHFISIIMKVSGAFPAKIADGVNPV